MTAHLVTHTYLPKKQVHFATARIAIFTVNVFIHVDFIHRLKEEKKNI